METRDAINQLNWLDTVKSYLPASWVASGPLIPVLRFSGTIGMVTPLRPGLTLSITSSAIVRSAGGTSRPMSCALFRLIYI